MELFKLQLNCSPEPFKVMETNPQYEAEVANHLAEIKNEIFEENISENPTAVFQSTCVDEMGTVQKKNDWLSASIKLLISLMKELRPQLGNSEKLKNKKKMWQAISEKMSENGYMFNAQQVQTKYHSLKRQYIRNKLHNDMNGRKRPSCLYQEELDELFHERKCITPEYVLDEESTVSTPEEEFLEEYPSSSKESFGNYRRKLTINKKTLQDKFLKRIDDLAGQTKEFENNTLQILKDLAEMGKRKEERAQREEERKKRKLELLETLVSKLTEK